MNLEEKCRKAKELTLTRLQSARNEQKVNAIVCVETLAALFENVMNLRPDEPDWPDRDRFVMGTGPEYEAFRALVEECSVKLSAADAVADAAGKGLGLAVDMALKARAEIKIYKTFVLINQADCLSGVLWESAIKASEYMLDDLTVILCRPAGNILPGADNICAKFSAFGFDTLSVSGQSSDAVSLALLLPQRSSRPRFLCCDY